MKIRFLCLDRWVGVLVLLLSVKVNSRSVFDVLGDGSGSDESIGKEVSWESQESSEGILGNSSYNQVPVNPAPSVNLDNVPVPYLKAPPPDTASVDAYGVGLNTGTTSSQESLSVESPDSPGAGSSEEWPHLAVYQVAQGQREDTINGSVSGLPQAVDGASQGQSTPADKPLRFSPRLSVPFSRSQPANYRSDLPFDRDDYRNYVVHSQPPGNGSNQTAQRVEYEFFCQEPGLHQLHVLHRTHKPGYIIAIYSEDRKFGTLDKVKCVSGEEADDDGDSADDIFEADEAEDDIYFELDTNQSEIISLNPEDAAHQAFCPSGYLLTGLSRSIQQNSTLLTADAQQPPPPTSYDVPPPLDTSGPSTEATTHLPGPPNEGHCSKLIRGIVDYTICGSVATLAKPGGSFEPYVEWNVECPFGHAAVGLKVHEKRVKSLRCCKLTRTYI